VDAVKEDHMPARFVFRLLVVLNLLAAFAVVMPAGAQAATLTVTNLNDRGPGSLRQAIAAAAPGDTITFQAGLSGTITLTSGQLTLAKDLTLAGPGADVLAISGNYRSRVLEIRPGVTAVIEGLTIRDGHDALHTADILNHGTLTLSHSAVTGNVGFTALVSSAGSTTTISDSAITQNSDFGVVNDGAMTITRSTIAENGEDGLRNYDTPLEIIDSSILNNAETGVEAYDALSITRSTIAGNGDQGVNNIFELTTITSSTISGNGLGIRSNAGGETVLASSTIAFNQTAGLATSGPVTLTNSIVAHNPSGNCDAIVDPLISGGTNLSSDATCFVAGGTDRLNTDPRLGPLADNGGPTLTHLPLPGSPAIDTGGPAPCPTATDQRGINRPQRTACDIGAVEVVPPPLLTVLSPNPLAFSSTPQTLVVRGHFFQAGATVAVGPQTYPATFVSSTELRVSLVPRDVFAAGWLVAPTAKVTVVNPDGARSNSLTLYLAR
jgi:hypothetical protein